VNQFYLSRFLGHGFHPFNQSFLIRMGRVTTQGMDFCSNEDLLPVQIDISIGPVAIFYDILARCSMRLIPHKEDII
jgi:hypothetical protein